MHLQHLQSILEQGEGITVEFKTARTELNHNVFETICAFLNRLGGNLILGVQDDGTPVGVDTSQVNKLKSDLITQSANPQKLSPPFTLFPEVVDCEGKNVNLPLRASELAGARYAWGSLRSQ